MAIDVVPTLTLDNYTVVLYILHRNGYLLHSGVDMAGVKSKKQGKRARPLAPRVVMSLHMPPATHAEVRKAASRVGEGVAEFIRKSAVARAQDVNETVAAQSAA